MGFSFEVRSRRQVKARVAWNPGGSAARRRCELRLDSKISGYEDSRTVTRHANAPKPLFTPDPEYSDKARKKKCRGTVLLETVVGTDGVPRDIRVTQPQGCGLNEQAIQALQKWRFEPGTRDGKPVPVSLMIEMDFRLY